jgi:hypothetical protein
MDVPTGHPFSFARNFQSKSFAKRKSELFFCIGGIAAFGGGSSRSELQIKEFKSLFHNEIASQFSIQKLR